MFSSTMEEPLTATSPPEPWLRLAVTAELLGVSASTVRRWCDTDRLACFRTAGGQRRFRRADVDLLLNGAGRRGPRGSGETDGPDGRGRRSRMRDRRSSDAERHNQMLTELLGLAGTITCRQDVSRFAQTVAERMKSLLGVCECAIFVGDGPRLFYAASVDAAGYDTISLATPVSLAEYPLCAGALERREVLVIASPDDPRLTGYERVQLLRQGLASELWIPLASRGHVVGAIDIHDDKPRDYAEILTLTTNVAQMVAGALETALLLDQVDRHAAELRGLAEMGELASQALDLDSFLVGVADQLLKATGAADCDVFTLDGDARLTCLVSRDRRAGNDAPVGEVLDVESYGPNTRAVSFKEIVVVAGRDDPLLTAADLVAYEKFGFESEVCVPLLSGEEVVGLVELFDDRPRDFAESLDFLRRVGQLVGGSCDKARLLDRLDRTNRDLSERSRTPRRPARGHKGGLGFGGPRGSARPGGALRGADAGLAGVHHLGVRPGARRPHRARHRLRGSRLCRGRGGASSREAGRSRSAVRRSHDHREHLRPAHPPGQPRVDGGLRREDLPYRAAALRRRADGPARRHRDGRGAALQRGRGRERSKRSASRPPSPSTTPGCIGARRSTHTA